MLKRPQTRTGRKPALTPWLVPAAALALLGCPNEDLAPLEPCTVSGVSDEIPVTGVDKVDLLFVIDNSRSMAQEQAKLAVELPNLVTILTTGKFDPNSEKQDFQPVNDLHLGVISSDMGASGQPGTFPGSCSDNGNLGDDGVLVNASRAGGDCMGVTINGANYMTFVPGMGPSAAEVAAQFRCIATLGTDGCGFEQQLEAMYKALAPSSVPFGSGGGHGDQRHQGFLREEAVLAVIQVSDEEDCSITNAGADLFNQNATGPNVQLDSGAVIGLNLRCGFKAGDTNLIHPTSRYVDGLLALKPANPDRIIFAAIVGIPLELDGSRDFDAMLKHPEMTFVADGDPEDPNTPAKKVCYDFDESLPATDDNYIVTDAVPGRRFVETAAGFAENGAVHSICAEDYAPALNSILEKISQKLKGGCLPRPLNPNKEGIVECDVVEVLPMGQTGQQCNPQRGRQFIEMRNVGGQQRAVCKINQVAVVNEQFQPSPNALQGVDPLTGWFYDYFTDAALVECPMETRQRISFVSGGTDFESAKPQGTTIRFECFQPVPRSDSEARGKDAAGSPCTPTGNECEGRKDPQPLIDSGRGFGLTCDEASNTCQIPCNVDSNCPDSWVCQPPSEANKPGLCVNPTCPPPTLR